MTKEERKAYMNAYNKANLDKMNAWRKAYYAANIEKCKAYSRDYYAAKIKKAKKIMTKDTPVLTGKDAENFHRRMKESEKARISNSERERMLKNYNAISKLKNQNK